MPTGSSLINVSDLSAFDYCPRSVYLTKVLDVKPTPTEAQAKGMVEHAVWKELSMRQPKILKAAGSAKNLESAIQAEIGCMASDIPRIYREWWKKKYTGTLLVVLEEVASEAGLIGEQFRAMIADMGFDRALRNVTPWRMEYTLKSEPLQMAGRMDKVMNYGFLVPVELKTGAPPENVRQGHRLQVCGYGLLLEDKLDMQVPYGLVDYARAHESRPVLIKEKLRREAVYARDAVLSLLEGDIPEVCPHGISKKCDACSLKEECFKI